jgi:4-hydroxy-2-oxoheptanedioate aldolase
VRKHRVNEAWAEGRVAMQIQMGTTLSNIEAIRDSEYDSIWFDMQHTAVEAADILPALIALRDSPITTIARLPGWNPGLAMKLLDSGVDGILCPQVDTPEHAAAVVEATKYPPLGNRSWGAFRRSPDQTPSEYLAQANDSTLTLLLIESRTALENIEAIVAVPGVDAVTIGPNDLAISHGDRPEDGMNYEHPVTRERLRRIIDASHAAGVKVMMLGYTPTHRRAAGELGADMLVIASELQLVAGGSADVLQSVRTEFAPA